MQVAQLARARANDKEALNRARKLLARPAVRAGAQARVRQLTSAHWVGVVARVH